jgi:hypothetical protein
LAAEALLSSQIGGFDTHTDCLAIRYGVATLSLNPPDE